MLSHQDPIVKNFSQFGNLTAALQISACSRNRSKCGWPEVSAYWFLDGLGINEPECVFVWSVEPGDPAERSWKVPLQWWIWPRHCGQFPEGAFSRGFASPLLSNCWDFAQQIGFSSWIYGWYNQSVCFISQWNLGQATGRCRFCAHFCRGHVEMNLAKKER